MAAGRNQRASHKCAVRQTIKRGQFADAVEKENRNIIRDDGIDRRSLGSPWRLSSTRNWQCRAPDKLSMRFVNELRGGRKLLRLARRKNQERIAVFVLQSSKRNERQRFLGSDHASGDDDRRAATALDFRFQPIRERRG